jgi:hypothetical protein
MRVASWVFVVCALVSALGLFVASVDVEIRGHSLGRRTSLSLHDMATDRDFVRRVLARYGHAAGRRYGEALADVALHRATARAKQLHVDDARDAMSTLDDVSDDDVKSAARALTIAIWGYVALAIAAAIIAFAGTQREPSRGRAIAGVALAVVLAAAAIGVHVALREAVWQANDEIGAHAVGLAAGAYLVPIAGAAALAAAIAVLVMQVRATRRGSA